MRQGMFTLSGAPCTPSHFDINILSILHYLGSPLGLCTLNFDLMRNLYIYNACTYILLLAVEASDAAAGSVLLQEGSGGIDHPICYFSRKFNRNQRKYTLLLRKNV